MGVHFRAFSGLIQRALLKVWETWVLEADGGLDVRTWELAGHRKVLRALAKSPALTLRILVR